MSLSKFQVLRYRTEPLRSKDLEKVYMTMDSILGLKKGSNKGLK